MSEKVLLSQNFTRDESCVYLPNVGAVKVNYLLLRELYWTVEKMKNILGIDGLGKEAIYKYIEKNIETAYNNGCKNIEDYIARFLNYLNNLIFSDFKKKELQETKSALLEECLKNLPQMQTNYTRVGDKGEEIIEFDTSKFRANKIAEENLEKYKKQCRDEIKEEYRKQDSKKFCENVYKNFVDGDTEYILEAVAIIDEEDTKTSGNLLKMVSKDLKRIYNVSDFDNSLKSVKRKFYDTETECIDEHAFKKERDLIRVKSLEASWKAIEMLEQNSGLLCCAIDGSWEFIDIEKIKAEHRKKHPTGDGIKSWLYVYTDRNGNISSETNFILNPWRYSKVWIMSLSAFAGEHWNVSDMKTYRLDRKLPENFLYEDEEGLENYQGYEIWLEI